MCQGETPRPLRPFSFDPKAKIEAGSVGSEGKFGADGVPLCPAASPGGVGMLFCENAPLNRTNGRTKIGPTRGVASIGVSYPKLFSADSFLIGVYSDNFVRQTSTPDKSPYRTSSGLVLNFSGNHVIRV